jgi:hypothetical protein
VRTILEFLTSNLTYSSIGSVHEIIAGMEMEAKLIVVQSSNSLSPSQQRVESAATDSTFPIVSSIGIMTAIAVSTYACISKQRQKLHSQKSSHKAICYSCEYFTNNLYLNCALHPTTVLTGAAVDCADYCPNSKAKRTEELKKALPFVSKIFPD